MLRTRLWMGAILILSALAVLWLDTNCAPWYPGFALAIAAIGYFSSRELLLFLPAEDRPHRSVTQLAVVSLLLLNWLPQMVELGSPFVLVSHGFVFWILLAFLFEMARYTPTGGGTKRVASFALVLVYLGLFPAFFVQLRFRNPEVSTLQLAAAIFIPKVGDIGAYTFGRLFGKHLFSPVLSPKKTWQGFAGAMLIAPLTAVAFWIAEPRIFVGGLAHSIVFGVIVGIVGIYGDLAESMMKRDGQLKDASKAVPGFGGLLDVIDSVIFAAPVAYLVLEYPFGV